MQGDDPVSVLRKANRFNELNICRYKEPIHPFSDCEVDAIVDGVPQFEREIEGALLEPIVCIDNIHGGLLKQVEKLFSGVSLNGILRCEHPEDIRSFDAE
ncbi:hypothetical protein SAMN05444398_1168 [Roseovarius pacificus]|uniref:Uncharacterized protein n=1 Tax=Roseovarius pacificus TaxID=337701 RepID=A0A1M7IN72_9RHOB|nr:hypothetical protein SAMN05444398_1168 [Roseovarius pacificus]